MSQQGRTLWQILTQKKPEQVAVELQHANPLQAKIGQFISVSSEEPVWGGRQYEIKDIQVYRRNGDPSQDIIDYRLFSAGVKEDLSVKMRLVPSEEGVDLKYNVILLNLFDELQYDEGLHQSCQDESGQFFVYLNEKDEELLDNDESGNTIQYKHQKSSGEFQRE